jgi:hypothetical protein
VSKELGNLPIVEDPSLTEGTVRVVLANDYTGPGSGLGSGDPVVPSGNTIDAAAATSTDTPPPPSPVLTAGSDGPPCVA